MKKKLYILTLLLIFISGKMCVGQTAYVTNSSSNSVSVINVATNTLTATIPVGVFPFGVSVCSDGSKVYVTNRNSNTVNVINTATNTISATIPVGNSPYGISVSPDGTKVYIAIFYDSLVRVINTATNTISAIIPVSGNPWGVSVSPDGSKVYVTNDNFPGTVNVINAATNTVMDTIMMGIGPRGIIVSPDGSKVYVTNQGLPGTVSVINTATDNISATIIVGSSPFGLSESPDGSKVYVANGGTNTVSVINTATNNVSSTITVGSAPYGVSISPDGKKVCVAIDAFPYKVSIINTATDMVSTTISVGFNPIAFGNFISSFGIITLDSIPTYVCAGSSLLLPFTAWDTLNNGNIFTAQLSNASGSFANPINIGTLTGTIAGSISAIIPTNTPAGTGYRIRVVSSNPAATGADNGTNITINPTYNQTVSASICQGTTYTFPDGTTDTMATVHTSLLSSLYTCDSSIVTTLTIHPTYNNSVSASICNGSTYTFPDGTIDSVATVHTSYFSTVNTCDSNIVTTLTINPTYNQAVSASICNGGTYTFPDGSIDTMATVHTSHLTSMYTCDSSIVTTLTINPTYSQTVSTSICPGTTYTFPDGTIDSIATVHNSHFSSVNTCDSNIVTTLTINPTYNQTVSASICPGTIYTFPDGTIDSIATVHTSHFSTVNTCDSSIVTTLTINPLPTVTLDFDTLTYNGRLVCQWWSYLALNGGSPAGGIYSGSIVTNDSIYPSSTPFGIYSITYTYLDSNSCSNSATDSVFIDICGGIATIDNEESTITISPNPFTNQLTVTSEKLIVKEIKVYTILGNEIRNYELGIRNEKSITIDLSGYAKGIYFVEIKTEQGIVRKKIVKQ